MSAEAVQDDMTAVYLCVNPVRQWGPMQLLLVLVAIIVAFFWLGGWRLLNFSGTPVIGVTHK